MDQQSTSPAEPSRFFVAVTALIVREGKILTMRRSEHHGAGAGTWEAVSGRIEAGEEPLDALTREVFEETGLRVGVDVEPDARPLQCYQTLRKTEPMVMIVYRLDYRSGSTERSWEHDQHEWLEPEVFAVRCKHLEKLNPVVLRLTNSKC